MMRNYGRNIGVVYGTRLIVTEMYDHCVKARILTGLQVLIGKVAITPTDNSLGQPYAGSSFLSGFRSRRPSIKVRVSHSSGLASTSKPKSSRTASSMLLFRVGQPSGVTVYQPPNDRNSTDDPLPVRKGSHRHSSAPIATAEWPMGEEGSRPSRTQ